MNRVESTCGRGLGGVAHLFEVPIQSLHPCQRHVCLHVVPVHLEAVTQDGPCYCQVAQLSLHESPRYPACVCVTGAACVHVCMCA